ncbi:MAG: RNA polymerase sigma factor [Armatimonadota bacterium]
MNIEKEQIYSELLVIRYQKGDSSAFNEFISYWEDRLFYYIRRLVDNEEDAWDALQETWLALVYGISKLKKSDKVIPWMYKIARNKAMDRLRMKYSNRELLAESIEVYQDYEDTIEFNFEDANKIHQSLDKLSASHREVLTLCFLEEFTVNDIAQILSIPAGTVKSRLYHAKCKLRAILEEEAQEE